MNFLNTVDRQVEEYLQREGQSVYDFTNNFTFTGIFRRYASEKNTNEAKKIYYPVSAGVKKGDTLLFQGDYYIVLNQDHKDSRSYVASLIEKCNNVLNLKGVHIPVIASSLDSPLPNDSSLASVVSGLSRFLATDTEEIRTFATINTSIFMYGGCFTIINTNYVNGLAYIYYKRETATVDSSIFSIGTADIGTLKAGDTALLLPFVSGKLNNNTVYCAEATFTFSSSNANVITVDAEGKITVLTSGEADITITAVYNMGNGSGDKYETISLVKKITTEKIVSTYYAQIESLRNYINTSTSYPNKIGVALFNSSTNQVVTERSDGTYPVPTWSYKIYSTTDDSEIKENANQPYFLYEVSVASSDGEYWLKNVRTSLTDYYGTAYVIVTATYPKDGGVSISIKIPIKAS